MSGEETLATEQNDELHKTSGKRLTWSIIAALVLTVVSLSYVLGTYNQINVVRESAAENWRALVDTLSSRHRGFELSMAKGVDSEEVAMEVGERFRLALDRFRTSSRQSTQLEAALEIETLAGDSLAVIDGPSEELRQAISDFNSAQHQLGKLVRSPAGKMLTSVLLFDEATEFQLAGK